MKSIAYLDFDLQIERTGDTYRAQVLSSPAGNATHTFSMPFEPLELENYKLRFGAMRYNTRGGRSPEAETAKSFGGKLFETVFSGEVRGCLRASLDIADQESKGLRLRLRLTEAPDLLDLPWEYLYNQTLNQFYALSVETPLVRYLEMPERIMPLAVVPPLRVLVMIASPKGYPPLDVEREWQKLSIAVRDLEARGLVVLERLEQPTLPALRRRMRTNDYHLFHFVGHGEFDPQAQDGMLIMEDEEGLGFQVSGQNLSVLMRNYRRTLRLVILNACDGGRTSGDDPFSGTAQRLVQQGIAAVIAMQFEITDETAIAFAQEFYAALTDGFPVDAALAEARQAISAEAHGAEWGTPVLYMRAPDGHIFDLKSYRKPQDDQPESIIWRDRRFEAAMPKVAQVGRPTEIRAMIALADSEGLSRDLPTFTEHGDLIAIDDVNGRGVALPFSVAQPDISIYLELDAPGFQINDRVEHLRVLHDRDSGVVTFLLTPTQPGQRARVSLRLYQDATSRQIIDTLTLYVDVTPSDSSAVASSQGGKMWQIASAVLRAPRSHLLEASVGLPDSAPAPTPIGAVAESSQPNSLPTALIAASVAPVLVPPQLEAPEGAMNPDSPFYVDRSSDAVGLAEIARAGGVTVTITGPRQIGKSSLLMRMKRAAEQAGKRVAFLDFQKFDSAALADPEVFFRQFCVWVGDELGLEDRTEEVWGRRSGYNLRASRYFEQYLFREADQPLVLAMDEVDGLFHSPFRSDFFGMLRAWNNDRAIKPEWRRLDLVQVTSTEPYRLIENLNQSPFNVGETIKLADFTSEQVAELNRRHGAPLTQDEQLQLIDLLGGHPYLVRRALYLIAGQRYTLVDLLKAASDDGGPFDAHLGNYLMRLREQKDLAQGMLQVIRAHSCVEESMCARLESMGLSRRDRGNMWPRCRLYAEYFEERLRG
jgi:hypothetical protein